MADELLLLETGGTDNLLLEVNDDLLLESSTPGDTLALPAISSGAALHAPSVAVGAVTLSLPAIASGASLAAPTVTTGAVTLALPAISSGAALYPPSLVTPGILELPFIAGSSVLYGSVLSQSVDPNSWLFLQPGDFSAPSSRLGPGATTASTLTDDLSPPD